MTSITVMNTREAKKKLKKIKQKHEKTSFEVAKIESMIIKKLDKCENVSILDEKLHRFYKRSRREVDKISLLEWFIKTADWDQGDWNLYDLICDNVD